MVAGVGAASEPLLPAVATVVSTQVVLHIAVQSTLEGWQPSEWVQLLAV